jgi:hypothetical protein
MSRLRTERAAALGIGAVGTALALVGVWMQLYMDFRVLPDGVTANKSQLAERVASYRWIAENVRRGESVLSANPVVYLYTGRKTASIVLLPIHWYRHDTSQLYAPLRELHAYTRVNGLTYVCLRSTDGQENEDARRYAAEDSGFREVFKSGETTVFRVLDSESSF